MTQLIKLNNNNRNTIVLNGTNNFSLRIEKTEDPKKANLENDVHFKVMMQKVPQVATYFNVIEKLGEGTFSKVYKAKLKRQYITEDTENEYQINNNELDQEYALKYIIPIVKPSRVAKELRFLRDLGGSSNIIPIRACFHNAGHTVIVMPIVEHDKFLDYLSVMNADEVRDYMKNLLIALDKVHSHGIIHRDIKPSNFLYNRTSRKYALVDFGLSQSEHELSHNQTLALQFQNQKNNSKSDSSKVRKNLSHKFTNNSNNDKEYENSKTPKRSFNEMNLAQEFITKRIKLNNLTESSVFISPVTPLMNAIHKNSMSAIAYDTPVKIRSPLVEDSNLLNIPHVENSAITMYKTPTKMASVPLDAIKTPVKNGMNIPDTPPKTVQKNLHFASSRSTPPSAVKTLKENIYLHPKPLITTANVKANFPRFQMAKKILQPELSTVSKNNENNNVRQFGESSKCAKICDCIPKAIICHGCLSKNELIVPRAGTPGFRAPEILLRCQSQTTKIDIWSCGVIFASLLSGRYPFFRCMDDMTCLAEIITIIGSSKVKRAARALGKMIVISRKSIPSMNLKKLMVKLRETSKPTKIEEPTIFPDSAYDLLGHLLDPNPNTRYSASQALMHPFFTETTTNTTNDDGVPVSS